MPIALPVYTVANISIYFPITLITNFHCNRKYGVAQCNRDDVYKKDTIDYNLCHEWVYKNELTMISEYTN